MIMVEYTAPDAVNSKGYILRDSVDRNAFAEREVWFFIGIFQILSFCPIDQL